MIIHPRFKRFHKLAVCNERCQGTEDCFIFGSCGPEMECAKANDSGKGIIPCSECACWTGEGMTIDEINKNIELLSKVELTQ